MQVNLQGDILSTTINNSEGISPTGSGMNSRNSSLSDTEKYGIYGNLEYNSERISPIGSEKNTRNLMLSDTQNCGIYGSLESNSSDGISPLGMDEQS